MAIASKYADLLLLIGEFSTKTTAEIAQLKEHFIGPSGKVINHDKEITALRASFATLENAHNKLVTQCKTLEETNKILCEKVAQLEQCVIISDASKNCAKECAIIEQAIEEFIMRLPRTPTEPHSGRIILDSLESRQFAIYKTILYIRADPRAYKALCEENNDAEHYQYGLSALMRYITSFETRHTYTGRRSHLWDEIAAKYKLGEIYGQYRKFQR